MVGCWSARHEKGVVLRIGPEATFTFALELGPAFRLVEVGIIVLWGPDVVQKAVGRRRVGGALRAGTGNTSSQTSSTSRDS